MKKSISKAGIIFAIIAFLAGIFALGVVAGRLTAPKVETAGDGGDGQEQVQQADDVPQEPKKDIEVDEQETAKPENALEAPESNVAMEEKPITSQGDINTQPEVSSEITAQAQGKNEQNAKPKIEQEKPEQEVQPETTEDVQGEKSPDIPLSEDLQAVLVEVCEANDVPLHIALGLIETESSFRTDAVSSIGAYGLCQLNPKYFPSGLSPEDNIRAGMDYLGELIDSHDSIDAALTAYNAGHDTGSRTYANKVLGNAEKWQ